MWARAAWALGLVTLAACETPPEGELPPPIPNEREALIVGGEAPRYQELDEEGQSVVIGGRAPNAEIARPTPMATPSAQATPVAPEPEAEETREVEIVEQPVLAPAPVIVVDPRGTAPTTIRRAPAPPTPVAPGQAGSPGVISGQDQRRLGGAGNPGVITGR